MFLIGTSSVKPIIGQLKPASIAEQANLPLNAQIVEVAGHEVLNSLIMFPLVLIVLFGAFYFVMRKKA